MYDFCKCYFEYYVMPLAFVKVTFHRHWLPSYSELQSMLVFFNPIKFGITFTFGNLCALGRFAPASKYLSLVMFSNSLHVRCDVCMHDFDSVPTKWEIKLTIWGRLLFFLIFSCPKALRLSIGLIVIIKEEIYLSNNEHMTISLGDWECKGLFIRWNTWQEN